MKTPDEINDEIRNQVNREMPPPAGGFENAVDEENFRAAQEARFFELASNYKQ